MNWKEFFKPTKVKIGLTILILILSNLLVSILGTPGSIQKVAFISVFSSDFFLYYILPIVLNILFYYPLACLASFAYNYSKEGSLSLDGKSLKIAMVLLVIFNPLTLELLTRGIYARNLDPCGAGYRNIVSGSPAEEAELPAPAIIYYIDGETIYNTDTMMEVLEEKSVGDTLELEIGEEYNERERFEVVLGEPPEEAETEGGFLGVGNITTPRDKICLSH